MGVRVIRDCCPAWVVPLAGLALAQTLPAGSVSVMSTCQVSATLLWRLSIVSVSDEIFECQKQRCDVGPCVATLQLTIPAGVAVAVGLAVGLAVGARVGEALGAVGVMDWGHGVG